MRISRSDGVEISSAPTVVVGFMSSLASGSLAFWRVRRLELLEQRIESLVVRFPVFPVALQPLVRDGQWLRLEAPRAPLRVVPPRYEPGTLEHFEMLRDRWLTHVERLGELVHRSIARCEARQ